MVQIPPPKLKEFLIRDSLITPENFDTLVNEASRLGQDLIDLLLSRNIISEKYLLSVLSSYYGVELVPVETSQLDDALVKLIPEDVARTRHVIILSRNADGSYNVGMENPSDLETIEFLTNLLKSPVKPFLVTGDDLSKAFAVYSRSFAQDFRRLIEENIRESLKNRGQGIEKAAADVPIVQLVNNILSYAASLGASDIHIEALEEAILIRYRIDGILHEIMRIPKEIHAALTARIKLLATLKLDEHSQPQDGRFRYQMTGGDLVDIRVSIMPTFHGEKSVMRLLPAAQKPMSLSELGLSPDQAKLVQENISRTYGMVLICGPTGSGKTTTLYALLNLLNKPEVNIVTVEDPIEYEIKYVNQTQINPRAGITFATGLRSILRQDPNIILVGEIRDEDTADISVHSALTGHLVLSSLHTNDAPTAVPRLMDMKVVPFLVAAVINIVIAQRLVRRICKTCIESYEPDASALSLLKQQFVEADSANLDLPRVLYRGRGCPACGGTGYRGRIGIFEVLNVTDAIREFITGSKFNLDSLQKMARDAGMATMFEDGIRKAQLGVTTLEEVLRVIRE